MIKFKDQIQAGGGYRIEEASIAQVAEPLHSEQASFGVGGCSRLQSFATPTTKGLNCPKGHVVGTFRCYQAHVLHTLLLYLLDVLHRFIELLVAVHKHLMLTLIAPDDPSGNVDSEAVKVGPWLPEVLNRVSFFTA